MFWSCFSEICRIGDGSLLARIQQLFEGHDDLLQKFMQFVPPEGINNYGYDVEQRTTYPVDTYPTIEQQE